MPKDVATQAWEKAYTKMPAGKKDKELREWKAKMKKIIGKTTVTSMDDLKKLQKALKEEKEDAR